MDAQILPFWAKAPIPWAPMNVSCWLFTSELSKNCPPLTVTVGSSSWGHLAFIWNNSEDISPSARASRRRGWGLCVVTVLQFSSWVHSCFLPPLQELFPGSYPARKWLQQSFSPEFSPCLWHEWGCLPLHQVVSTSVDKGAECEAELPLSLQGYTSEQKVRFMVLIHWDLTVVCHHSII